MRYVSTRDPSHRATLSEAIARGIAPDGGLYVPSAFPSFAPGELGAGDDVPAIAARLLAPFFAGDALAPALPDICRESLTFPLPLKMLARRTAVLELFHGPTAAFKDVGARFLAACLSRIAADDARPLTLLVATSGDTGGAVAAAFHGRPGIEVVILFPKGMVSLRQQRQLTCWGGNVRAFAVRGDFDACQRMAKEAFADASLRAERRLSSANSINVGRLLPQMVPYAVASLAYLRERGAAPGFIVPTGNVGNSAAAMWARRVGLPVREVVLATNANRTVADFAAGRGWEGSPTVPTLASAMDVGRPSNLERVLHLFGGADAARSELRALVVSDDEIRDEIRRGEAEWGEVWDPHTATAAAVRRRIAGEDWVLVSTAHPAKFESVVEPLVGHDVPVPPALAALLDRPAHSTEIDANLGALRTALHASG
ncbi:MAG TPA: threonine synthase [Longimicrobiaceae bacterium]|nr:threonine synthase [Longimicrobiaceae bacterium]